MNKFVVLAALVGLSSPSFADPVAIPPGVLDCAHAHVVAVDFSDCYFKRKDDIKPLPAGQDPLDHEKTVKLENGRFERFPNCSAQVSVNGSTVRLFEVDPRGQPTCAPSGPNSYCLSPEQHIEANSPPCIGKTMADKCIFSILPQILSIPDGAFFDSRYQCTCYKTGCGHLIGYIKRPDGLSEDQVKKFKFPTVTDIQSAFKRIVPGCDDVAVKEVTPPPTVSNDDLHQPIPSIKKMVDFALSSRKCPLLVPADINPL